MVTLETLKQRIAEQQKAAHEKAQMIAKAEELKRQEKRERVILRLTEEVASLLKISEDDNLHWNGSCIDLMEVLYEVWMTRIITDENGLPFTFKKLVKIICSILHAKEPRNPYYCAKRGSNRKGILHQSYLDKYQYLFEIRRMKEPLWDDITMA